MTYFMICVLVAGGVSAVCDLIIFNVAMIAIVHDIWSQETEPKQIIKSVIAALAFLIHGFAAGAGAWAALNFLHVL